jgi:hypothetical protein
MIAPMSQGKTRNIQRFQAVLKKSGSKMMIAIPFNLYEVWGEKQR